MERRWYRRDDAAVVAALRRGERPEMAANSSSGPLDDLIGLHEQLGVFDALDQIEPNRRRRGVDDGLLLRTLAVLPFLEAASLSGATGQLFRDPAVLLHLGWSALQLEWGDNERHRNPHGRQSGSLPCHVDTLRDALRRITQLAWDRVQRAGVKALFEHRLVRGRIYAIDGTGLGNGLRLVSLVCVSALRPVIVAWRLLAGSASEKGREAAVTRSLIEQALELGGSDRIELLLVDALYADGPLLAWLKYQKGIDVVVPVPSERDLHYDLEALAAAGKLRFRRHSYVRSVQGHKQRRTVEVALQGGLTSWESFVRSAQQYGAQEPCLWGCLVREVDDPQGASWTLVSTCSWPSAVACFQAYRPRWHIENDAYRELKEGWQLEAQRWGRDEAVQIGRVTLTCLAFNTAQTYLAQSGIRLAARGIRRLRRTYDAHLGASPCVIYYRDCFAVIPVEQLLKIVGVSPRRSLLPFQIRPQPP